MAATIIKVKCLTIVIRNVFRREIIYDALVKGEIFVVFGTKAKAQPKVKHFRRARKKFRMQGARTGKGRVVLFVR